MTAEPVRVDVPLEAAGARLDSFLAARMTGPTRSTLRRWILEGRVLVNGEPAGKAGFELSHGMRIEVRPPADTGAALTPEAIPIEVLHEDEHIVVVSKPAGLVVHPGHGNRTGTLVHALLGRGIRLAPAGGADRPGIVHRLDSGTTGVMVVAKSDEAHKALARAFADRKVRKIYRALVWGKPKEQSGRIEGLIGRSRRDPTKMAVSGRSGRPSATSYDTLEVFPGFALLKVGIETGRTHQIRVHLQSIHHPVVGDKDYGGEQWRGVQDPAKRNALRKLDRPALHASELSFVHPGTGKRVTYKAPLPADFEAVLAVLRGGKRK